MRQRSLLGGLFLERLRQRARVSPPASYAQMKCRASVNDEESVHAEDETTVWCALFDYERSSIVSKLEAERGARN